MTTDDPSSQLVGREELDRVAVLMSEDLWVTSIGRVESAADDLHKAVEGVVDSLREARIRGRAGVGHVDIVKGLVAHGGKVLRLAPTVAFRDFERAMTDYRASMIRTLVDEDHMTFTEVGEIVGVSRQMVARLYRRAGGSGRAAEGRDEN